jgi:cytochrome c5
MPPHGGNMNLSDLEIERAITYMVNQSGGNWVEPISRTAPPVERTGEQIVKAQCFKCHETGKGGAPKIGDRDAWIPRLKEGLDNLVRSAIKGHGGMPARGGTANLTDSELRSAITYLFSQGQVPQKPPSGAPSAAPDRNHRIVDGTEVFLGVVSAESLRAQHPKPDKESKMHGGIPGGKNYYHVNVSLFDSKTKAAITDAQVEASVSEPVAGGETKKLELVRLNNAQSYGNYFRMSSNNPYTITVRIRKPGSSRAIEAKFDFKH